MKLSISNIAWSAEFDEEVHGVISELGFVGLEIAPTRIFPKDPYLQLGEASKFARDLKSRWGLVVSSMQSIWFGRTEQVFGSDDDRRALVEYTRLAVDFAVSVGCPNLVFGSPKNRRQEHPDLMAPEGLAFFREIAAYAHECGTVIALEPNPEMYGTNFVNTSREAFALVREVDHPGLRVNYDIGAVIANSESLDHLRENLDLVSHIHISEPGLAPIEPRSLHEELAAILCEAQYGKFISIEMKKCQDIGPVKAAVNLLKELFH